MRVVLMVMDQGYEVVAGIRNKRFLSRKEMLGGR